MNEALTQRFIWLVSANTGLQIRDQDREIVLQKVLLRMQQLRLSTLEAYCQLLESGTVWSESEWQKLIPLLTTAETYFFRDKGQFSLLRHRILPELIGRQQRSRSVCKSLRIWSAGCSTGEEAYSLAILVRELLPMNHRWDVAIVGTDINQVALEKAQQGIYSDWSFRHTDSGLRQQYFELHRRGWELDRQVRSMVSFRYGNLLLDRFPDPAVQLSEIDLIVCRNVFVYFSTAAIATVLEKFCHSLRPGGYLMTGHTELHGQTLEPLQARVFRESLLYQRQEALPLPLSSVQPMTDLQVVDTPSIRTPLKTTVECVPSVQLSAASVSNRGVLSPSPQPESDGLFQLLHQAELQFRRKAYAAAIRIAEQVLASKPSHFKACFLLARAYANSGTYEKARDYCEQALAISPFAIAPYFLLAHIAEEQGDVEGAKIFLKRIIYLAPASILAYLELGSLYECEGDTTRSRKMRLTAVDLLKQLPPHAPVDRIICDRKEETVTAATLLSQVEKRLKSS